MNSELHDIDFTNADLSNIQFSRCDLSRSTFDQTLLEKTDFTTAIHFSINLEKNKVKKAKFAKDNLRGLLDSFDIIIE